MVEPDYELGREMSEVLGRRCRFDREGSTPLEDEVRVFIFSCEEYSDGPATIATTMIVHTDPLEAARLYRARMDLRPNRYRMDALVWMSEQPLTPGYFFEYTRGRFFEDSGDPDPMAHTVAGWARDRESRE